MIFVITICNFGVPTSGKYLAVVGGGGGGGGVGGGGGGGGHTAGKYLAFPPPPPPQPYAILKLRGNPGYRRPPLFGSLGEVGHV